MEQTSRRFREELRRALPGWERDGLVSPEAAGVLRARYQLDAPDADGPGLLPVYVLGALLLGAGVISLVAWHWDAMPAAAKLVVIGGAMVAAHGGGFTLWRGLRHNPSDPQWCNRDRFVLSGGHGSMLLYSLLHLSGYAVPLEQLKQFRQLNSITPGHPEYGVTPGVEVTTGPLGQGIANATGMALAEAFLAANFNRPGYPVVDHYTYVFAGDGDMEEGAVHGGTHEVGHARVEDGFACDAGVARNHGRIAGGGLIAYGLRVLPGVDARGEGRSQAEIVAELLQVVTRERTLILTGL